MRYQDLGFVKKIVVNRVHEPSHIKTMFLQNKTLIHAFNPKIPVGNEPGVPKIHLNGRLGKFSSDSMMSCFISDKKMSAHCKFLQIKSSKNKTAFMSSFSKNASKMVLKIGPVKVPSSRLYLCLYAVIEAQTSGFQFSEYLFPLYGPYRERIIFLSDKQFMQESHWTDSE